MAGITGQGTTFNLPNYVGELFAVSPTDTPFLSSIGGLTGGEKAAGVIDQWQTYDLRNADKHRQRLEGADAPTAEGRARGNVINAVEIHQEKIETSYTKQSTPGQFASTGSAHTGAVGLAGMNPVQAEHPWQVEQALKQVARDIEKGFVNGTFQLPSDNATARKTRGLLPAITTNVTDSGTIVGDGASTFAVNGDITETSHGLSVGDPVVARTITSDAIGVVDDEQIYYVLTAADANTFTIAATLGGATITFPGTTGAITFYEPADLTAVMVLDTMQSVYENGGIMEMDTATLMAPPGLQRALTKLFVTDKGYQEQSREIGGVRVRTILTDFGEFNTMMNRHMPSGALAVVSLEQCAPRFLEVPGKGFLFVEELATTGSADKDQIYGEIGLKYGNERAHGKIVGVKKPAAA